MPCATTRLRRLTAEDDQRLLAITEACDTADFGRPDYTLDDVRDDLTRAGWRGWGVEDENSNLLAYCWVDHRSPHPYVVADVRVRPDQDVALGAPLLEHVRREAAALETGAPVQVFTAAAGREQTLLAAAGGEVVRHHWRMAITLPATPPAVPACPDGVTVDQPEDDETQLRVVHHVIDTAFLDHFGSVATDFAEWHERQRTSPGADLGLWWIARVDGEPAAVLIGRDWPDLGWVQGVGTLREFRGRGLGRLLLLKCFAEFHRRGQRDVGLSVDASNPTGAVGLYESVGMQVDYEVLRYELPAPEENRCRDGR